MFLHKMGENCDPIQWGGRRQYLGTIKPTEFYDGKIKSFRQL